MKNTFLKYLLCLALGACASMAATACKGDDGGNEKVVYLSSSSSIENEISESDFSESTGETSESVGENSQSDLLDSSDSETSESSTESSDRPQDDFPEGDTPHKEHHIVTDGAEPDCLNDGFFKEWCENCDYVVQEYSIPAFGHTPKTVEGYSPNCQKTGLTESTYCETCGATLKEATIIPTIEHNYTLGLGSCPWCDVSVLRYEVRSRQHNDLMKQYYAVCLGAVEFTPYSVTRFVNIPDTVTVVQDGIIYENVPVVEIEPYAFHEAYDVNTLIIGANVETIGRNAFLWCYNLREVYDKSQARLAGLGETENGAISRYVQEKDIHFDGDYTSKVSVDEESGCITYTDGDLVELIGIRDTVEHLVIPEGVTKISTRVFYKTRVIKELTIAKSVNFIAENAFAFDCEKHQEEGHTNAKCKFQLKKITFLNPERWRAYEYLGQNYVEFHPEELNPTETGAWKKLVLERYLEWEWKREDYFVS